MIEFTVTVTGPVPAGTVLGSVATICVGAFGASASPYWVKLVRAGNVFTAFISLDGVTWTQIGAPTTVVMAPTVYVGLVASGFGALDTATFDNVSLTVGTTPYISGVSPLLGGARRS